MTQLEQPFVSCYHRLYGVDRAHCQHTYAVPYTLEASLLHGSASSVAAGFGSFEWLAPYRLFRDISLTVLDIHPASSAG